MNLSLELEQYMLENAYAYGNTEIKFDIKIEEKNTKFV